MTVYDTLAIDLPYFLDLDATDSHSITLQIEDGIDFQDFTTYPYVTYDLANLKLTLEPSLNSQ